MKIWSLPRPEAVTSPTSSSGVGSRGLRSANDVLFAPVRVTEVVNANSFYIHLLNNDLSPGILPRS